MNKIFSLNNFFIILILVVSASLMLLSSSRDSAIMDELTHIPSGYSYVKYSDYRLNPEHPPLLKALSGLTLLPLNLNFPTDKPSWQEDVNGQWASGEEFLYQSGNDADKIIQYSRLAPIIITLLLSLLIYIWSSRLLGRFWALLPTFFFSLSPNILAHGHYVTTDLAAAFGIVFASFFFINFLEKPTKKSLVFAGFAFGIAQLLKFSALLLGPFFILLVILKIISNNNSLSQTPFKIKIKFLFKEILKKKVQLFAVFFIGFLVIYAVYIPFTANYPVERQNSDASFILSSFANGPTPEGEICSPLRCLAELDIWLTGQKITQPIAEYLLGVLMVFQRSSGGNTAYFLGEVGAGGWWYYFPVAFLLKEPLPSLILIIFAFILAILNIVRQSFKNPILKLKDYLKINFAELSMIIFVIFYWAYSIRSPLNIGFRHIIPTLPFIYILTFSSLKKWIDPNIKNLNVSFISRILKTFQILSQNSKKIIFIGVICLWFVFETAFSFPFFLSYYNQLGEGTNYGYRFITDSNYDWGQDLKALTSFVEKNNIEKIAVDYFGGDNPKYRLGNKFVPWWSAKNNPKEEGIEWLAVSINTLENSVAETAPYFERKPEDGYLWLKSARNVPLNYTEPPKPDFRAGTSIFIYKL